MPGALLRSGKLQEFKPLGEDGQPVYTSALQLREAIRLKLGRDAAHCLAVPQRNETGDRIDWYAPEEGDVVPWSAATDDERVQAKAMLEKMHASLLQVGSTMRGEQSRDRQIFGRLLEKVIYFPDDTHVYLVNGKPVLTFWGFTDPLGGSGEDPLGRLQPRAAVATPVSASPLPVAEPAPLPPPVPVAARKRFPWWWLLLLLLLLLLLYFLLRSCAPDVPLPFVEPDVTEEQPVETVRDGVRYDADGNVISTVDGSTTSSGVTEGSVTPDAGTEPPPDLQPDAMTPEEGMPEETPPAEEPTPEEPATEPPAGQEPAAEEPPVPEEPPQEEQPPTEPPAEEQPPAGEPPAPEEQPAEQQQPTPPELQDQAQQPKPQSGQQPPMKPLEIPPDAARTGNTDFLDGKWKAGAGIQDARTGKPMRLDYDFKDGKGKVKITGSDGVECVGDVNTSMSGGGLVINNQGQAKCKDGSTYKLPNVTCKPGATSAADCSGQYDNSNKFPISMKQGG